MLPDLCSLFIPISNFLVLIREMVPIIISMCKVFLNKNLKKEKDLDLEEIMTIKILNFGLIKTSKNQQSSMEKILLTDMDP
jgi:hypothetical protein